MRIHFVITALSCQYFGFGLAIMAFGRDAGLSISLCNTIYFSSLAFFLIVVFTSVRKIQMVLYKKPTIEQNDERVVTTEDAQ